MLNIYSDNFPVPKDDDISTVDHVLRYYETINLDIEGSKKILETFDSVHRGFKVPSPSQEAIAAATARTEGVSNVVPSGSAGDLVRILDDSNPAQPQEPVPSPATQCPHNHKNRHLTNASTTTRTSTVTCTNAPTRTSTITRTTSSTG